MNNELVIYSWDRCLDCIRIKMILNLKNIKYTEIIVDNEHLQSEVVSLLGKFCVPAIKLCNNINIDDTYESVILLDNKVSPSIKIITKEDNPKINLWLEETSQLYRKVVAPVFVSGLIREFNNEYMKNQYIQNLENSFECSFENIVTNHQENINYMLEKLNALENNLQHENLINGYSISTLNLFSRLYWINPIHKFYQNLPIRIKEFIDHSFDKSQIKDTRAKN